MKIEYRFERVRKRAVPDVVQKRGNQDRRPRLVGNFIFAAELVENSRREMHRAEAVRKARMLRRLVSEMRQAELFYAPKTLKFSRVDQPREQLSFVAVRLDADDVVNRIAIYFFRQIFLLCARKF